jgi:hypothetical protein
MAQGVKRLDGRCARRRGRRDAHEAPALWRDLGERGRGAEVARHAIEKPLEQLGERGARLEGAIEGGAADERGQLTPEQPVELVFARRDTTTPSRERGEQRAAADCDECLEDALS